MPCHRHVLAGAAASIALAASAHALASPHETVLHSFGGLVSGESPQAGLIADASGALYGTTHGGGGEGPNPAGTVFRLTPPAAGQTAWTTTVLHAFAGGRDGAAPDAALIADATGALYGTTSGGGRFGAGTVFRLAPPAAGQTVWTETVLHEFQAGDGAHPHAALIADAAGALYGTAYDGGRYGRGLAFKLTPPATGLTAWTETALASFKGGSDGANPRAALVFGADGALYGTTVWGGHYRGTVFRLTPPAAGAAAWTKTILYRFAGEPKDDGAHPYGSLILDSGGALYGTTEWGGTSWNGTVFKLTPPAAGGTGWSESVLYQFAGGTDGAHPMAGLIADAGGAVYGTTNGGGASGAGTLFRLAPPAAGGAGWTETVLHGFGGGTDGANPDGSLIAGPGGTLYGTTSAGTGTGGTVFALAPPAAGQSAWTETVLEGFGGVTDGTGPQAALLPDGSGGYFGTATGGGSHGGGIAFRLTPPVAPGTPWVETVLHSFSGDEIGTNPTAALIAGPNGTLYGTTFFGGAVFALTPPAAGPGAWRASDLGSVGAAYAGVVRAAGGALYGTVTGGVAFELAPPPAGGKGWTQTTLYNFPNSPSPVGSQPYGGLLPDGRGGFYGVNYTGGANGSGTAFQLSPPAAGQSAWSVSVLYAFVGNGGPTAALISDASGALYGTTEFAGDGAGQVFKLTPPAAGQTGWTYTPLHVFDSVADGEFLFSGLYEDAAGALYGTTYSGGPGKAGTVFKLTPPAPGESGWTKTILYGFAGGDDGATPFASLVADAKGALYSTTVNGGRFGEGTVFMVTP